MTDVTARLSAALADRYRLERELGQGGMATVYLAEDLKHKRHVAVKVLRPELAAMLGGERFVQEITTTAALQHPHILPLFDSGTADGFLYYVMPYVEGETLRTKLDRERQLGIGESVRIATEVADALDYAHRHGVIHRDIKPENILLHDGRPLVADFGIALALSAAAGGRMTETGMSLGTPHYMSPEQATAEKEITARSDVYSLASVLYEMLAGQPPHVGGSAQQIIMKIIAEEARAVTELRRSVPANVAAALSKALERLPADRFETAKAFAEALQNPGFTLATSATGAARGVAARRPAWDSWRDWRPWALAAGLAAIGVAAGRLTVPGARPRPVVRFEVPLPSEHSITGAPVNTLALSPDGRTAVYVGRTAGISGYQLFERRLDELGAFRPIPNTEYASFPSFSPDGTKLGFLSRGAIAYVSVPFTGGAPAHVASASAQSLIAWVDNRTVAFNDDSGAVHTSDLEGTVRLVAVPNHAAGERALWVVGTLPDGRGLLVIVSAGGGTTGKVAAIDPANGRRTTVLPNEVSQVWYADGCLLWTQPAGALQAATFDARRLRLTSAAVTLADPVRQAIGGGGQMAVSSVGSLVYLPDQPPSLVLVDRKGTRDVLATGHHFHSPRFSPDGRRLALDFIQDGLREVYTFDLAQRTMTRVSFEGDGHDPVWSPDGRWIYFVHGPGVWRRLADGSGTVDSVSNDAGTALEVERDGTILTAAGLASTASGGFDIDVLSATTPRKAKVLLGSPYTEEAATLSPDGRWLAYASDETGRSEVYVRQYPTGGAKVLVSRGGGTEPRWNRDGRTLYYDGQKDGVASLIAATVVPGSEFTVSTRTQLFDISDYEPAEPHANWDVAPDGSRFVAIYQGALSDLAFILNWPEEVRRQAKAGR